MPQSNLKFLEEILSNQNIPKWGYSQNDTKTNHQTLSLPNYWAFCYCHCTFCKHFADIKSYSRVNKSIRFYPCSLSWYFVVSAKTLHSLILARIRNSRRNNFL